MDPWCSFADDNAHGFHLCRSATIRGVNLHWPHDSVRLLFSCQQFEGKTVYVIYSDTVFHMAALR